MVACEGPQAQLGAAKAHLERGLALYGNGDRDGAVAEFRQAIRLRPNHAVTHYNLATDLHVNGDLDGTITENRQAIRLKPDLAVAYGGLGQGKRGLAAPEGTDTVPVPHGRSAALVVPESESEAALTQD